MKKITKFMSIGILICFVAALNQQLCYGTESEETEIQVSTVNENATKTNEDYVNEVMQTINWDYIKNKNDVQSNVISNLKNINDYVDSNGVRIQWKTSDNRYITKDGRVYHDTISHSVTFTCYINKGSCSKKIDFNLIIPPISNEEMVHYQPIKDVLDSITWEQIEGKNESKNAVKYNLNLPQGVYKNGISLKWKVNDDSYVDINTGKITIFQNATNVALAVLGTDLDEDYSYKKFFYFTLQAGNKETLKELIDEGNIKYNDSATPNDGKYYSEEIRQELKDEIDKADDIYNDEDSSAEEICNEINQLKDLLDNFNNSASYITDEMYIDNVLNNITWDNIKNKNDSMDNVTGNLVNLNDIKDNNVEIEWISSRDKYLNSDGTVNRPKNGDRDRNVILTVNVTKNNTTKSKEFDLIIKSEPVAEDDEDNENSIVNNNNINNNNVNNDINNDVNNDININNNNNNSDINNTNNESISNTNNSSTSNKKTKKNLIDIYIENEKNIYKLDMIKEEQSTNINKNYIELFENCKKPSFEQYNLMNNSGYITYIKNEGSLIAIELESEKDNDVFFEINDKNISTYSIYIILNLISIYY